MNILVVGAHFYNKGAHLMMKTVLDELKGLENYRLFLSPCSGTPDQIKSLGYETMDYPLKHVTAYRSFDIFYRFGGLIKFLKKEYRGTLEKSKIDAVLDISGFAYSDQWGKEAVLNVNKVIKLFKQQKAKYIFLPQAFGPFTGDEIKENMAKAIDKSDLVLVRDLDSLNMLKDLSGSPKIKLYPDITIGLKPVRLEENIENYSCIVPNERMLDQGREYWPDGKYLEYVNQAIKALIEGTDDKIFIVVHDRGEGDVNLAKALKEIYPTEDRISLYFEEDPVILKSFLGNSNIVIGSRFHALVSALSQNIPCLALGWSHKYKTLFSEYGIGDCSFSKPDDVSYSLSLKKIISLENRKVIINTLSSANVIHKEQNRKMWVEVINILNS